MTYFADLLGRPLARDTAATASAMLVAFGVLLMFLAAGLRRRKIRAWQLATAVTVVLAFSHLGNRLNVAGAVVALAVFAILVASRRQFYAAGDPATRWYAVRVVFELAIVGLGVGVLALTVSGRRVIGHPSWSDRFREIVLGFFGANGPVQFRRDFDSDVVGFILGGYGILILCVGAYLILRSAQPRPALSPVDEQRLRGLLADHGADDSLGYFALRRDKSAVWSTTGKSAIAYRVVAGVALASGDPIGDPEAWPGVISAFLELAARHAWTPAVLGASEHGATVYRRHGLDALELGDEAIVDTSEFTLQGRAMRGVRQAVGRLDRVGYQVRVRRVGELSADEMAEVTRVAAAWRGKGVERGFSMALSRLGDPADAACVLVTAHREGRLQGLLHLVPWGGDGLSLDAMRRDRDADNGLNELLITRLMEASCDNLGVRRVSLNFAVFRAALERGERIGAGPVLRGWRRMLIFLSRWWQIESLYRFNRKFQPQWQPRFLSFTTARDLPRIAFAALQAESFLVMPRWTQRLLRRDR